MAGYSWADGKSNNAVAAVERGLITYSEISAAVLKAEGLDITVHFAKWLAANGHWEPSEWHHTSAKFNETNYYSVEHLSDFLHHEDYAELAAAVRKAYADRPAPAKSQGWEKAIGTFKHYEGKRFIGNMELDGKSNGKRWQSKCGQYTKLLSGHHFRVRPGTLAAEKRERIQRTAANARRAGTTAARVVKMEQAARALMDEHRGCTDEVYSGFARRFKGFRLEIDGDGAQLFKSFSGKTYTACRVDA